MVNNFKPNLESMQQYLNKESERNARREGSNVTWWSIPQGMSAIRILPPWDPSGRIALPVLMHPIEYQDETMKYKKYKWTCLNKTFGKPCKICEGLQEMVNAGVNVEKWEASRRTFYMNILVMYDPNHEKDIQAGKSPEQAAGLAAGTLAIMRTPKTVYDWVISNITNPMIGDITDINSGIDVYITKKGTGLGTEYSPTLSPNGRTAIPQEYLKNIESLNNLDDIFGTGFSDDQVNKLVTSLKRNAGVMANQTQQTVQQMAGYQSMPPMPQTPVYQQPSPVQNQPVTTVPYPNPAGQSPNMGVQENKAVPQSPVVAPSPFTSQSVPPVQQTPVAPQPANKEAAGRPKCFGQYDATNVTCVICPHEIECGKVSNN